MNYMETIKVTDIVLLIIAISFCIGFFMHIITGEQFLPVILLVFGYFYGDKKNQEVTNAIAGMKAKSCDIDKLG